MKTLLILTLITITTIATAQNILRVNNTPGINASYTTIAAAVAAAGVNDIIQVEGSAISYGDITINKKVTLVGPGYFLTENSGLQANFFPASVGDVSLVAGSSNSSISRLTAGGISITNVSNISVTNNRIIGGASVNGTGSNTLIGSNYMGTFASNSSNPSILVTNNYIFGQVVVNSGFVIFTYNTCSLSGTAGMISCLIQNNIFMGFPISFTTSVFDHNLFTQSTISGADPSNQFSVSTANLFVGLTGNTTDTQWRLKSGSQAIGAGTGATDCGIYGGSSPYRISGIINGQPTITNINMPAQAPQNGTLNVKVSAKVN